MEAQERKAQAERIQRAEQAGMQESERMSFILATYQRNLEVSESKLAAAQQENVDLHIQINQLIQNNMKNALNPQPTAVSSLPPITESTPTITAATNNTQQADNNAAITKMNEEQQQAQQQRDQKQAAMYEMLTSEIQDLKRQLLGSRAANRNQLPAHSVDEIVSSDLAALENDPETEMFAASRKHKPTPPTTPQKKDSSGDQKSAGDSSSGETPAVPPVRRKSSAAAAAVAASVSQVNQAPHPQHQQLQQEIEECRQYIKQLESNANNAMSQHLRIAESKALAMSTRASALEEELKSYQQYMRNVVPQYKKQLAFVKQQLAVAMKANGVTVPNVMPGSDSPGTGSELKLPLIK